MTAESQALSWSLGANDADSNRGQGHKSYRPMNTTGCSQTILKDGYPSYNSNTMLHFQYLSYRKFAGGFNGLLLTLPIQNRKLQYHNNTSCIKHLLVTVAIQWKLLTNMSSQKYLLISRTKYYKKTITKHLLKKKKNNKIIWQTQGRECKRSYSV